jgi:hypothetical protein
VNLHLAATYWNEMRPGQRFYDMLAPHGRQHCDEARWLLESYHYLYKPELMAAMRRTGEKLFLDSGAFSAWSMGVTVDLEKYCRFIHEYSDCFYVASVLDVIGSAEGTYENQKKMERLGTRPIPCFHYGEDPAYCEYYVNNYEYMALGGFGVAANRGAIMQWLDEVWEKYLTDGAGRPRIKVHGFAITAVPLMVRYPWWSVDSSSWVQISSVGNILHPDHGIIAMSSNSPARKTEGHHFDNMSKLHQSKLAYEFAQLGYTLTELRDSYVARRAYCMWAYQELNRRINTHDMVYTKEQPGLF